MMRRSKHKKVNKWVKVALASLFAFIVVVVAGVGLLSQAMFADQSAYSEHLAAFEGLPDTAADITVFSNMNITGTVVAEFTIREADFVAWAAAHEWPLTEISTPIEIGNPRAFHEGTPNRRTTVENGLHASLHRENNGGVDIAYDRQNGLGRISRSSR